MANLKELKEQKIIKVLKNLMEGDRVEITYAPNGNRFALPVTIMPYFVAWRVFEKTIDVCGAKLGDRIPFQNPSRPIVPISIGHIIEIKKIIPTR